MDGGRLEVATDFFEYQDQARRNTTRLVGLFALAVLAIGAMLYAIAAVVIGFRGTDPVTGSAVFAIQWVDPALMLQVALLTLLVVGGASLYRIAQLSGGGRVVAEGLGGRLLHSDSAVALERQLLNVVEEMAIASGTPTPPVYLLDQEAGINAFAAGFTPSDAVIGITRGCAERLSRDELQGVVAHEFSHILNGDMRLNIRLMGVLYGILVIGMIGFFLLRSSFWVGAGSRRSSRDNSAMAMVAIGAGLMGVGALGMLIGNLIKASVSRQREFLADASAVQYTRNPAGIAGALKKIGGFDLAASIESPAAAEASHMFFGRAVSSGMNAFFASHPPLDERVRRLDPSWQGVSEAGSGTPGVAAGVSATAAGFAGAGAAQSLAESPVEQIGRVSTAHLEYAARLVEELPKPLVAAAREPYGARAVIYALLLDADPRSRRRQLEALDRAADDGVAALTREFRTSIETLGVRHRLPLVDLTLPALRELSAAQYRNFQLRVRELVEADERIDLFEWTLQRILLAHLAPSFEGARNRPGRPVSAKRLGRQLAVVLSTLARVGGPSESEMDTLVRQSGEALGVPEVALLPVDQVGLAPLDRALTDLAALAPAQKRQLLRACARIIAADRRIADDEAELFRAVADTLGCPVPPLLPGQPWDRSET